MNLNWVWKKKIIRERFGIRNWISSWKIERVFFCFVRFSCGFWSEIVDRDASKSSKEKDFKRARRAKKPSQMEIKRSENVSGGPPFEVLYQINFELVLRRLFGYHLEIVALTWFDRALLIYNHTCMQSPQCNAMHNSIEIPLPLSLSSSFSSYYHDFP